MTTGCVRAPEDDLEGVAIHQQRLHKILLVPASTLFDRPDLGIVKRQENVVDVNQDPCSEPRNDLEIDMVHIGSGCGGPLQ